MLYQLNKKGNETGKLKDKETLLFSILLITIIAPIQHTLYIHIS